MRTLLLVLTFVVAPRYCVAQTSDAAPTGDMPSGVAEQEVEVVSANGSITRAKCPYTCENRGIPKAHCREWKSKMYGDQCYVQDLRLQSNAVPVDGGKAEHSKK